MTVKDKTRRKSTQKRYEKIMKLRESGLSFDEIGKLMGGISKQRAWQIYRRAIGKSNGRNR